MCVHYVGIPYNILEIVTYTRLQLMDVNPREPSIKGPTTVPIPPKARERREFVDPSGPFPKELVLYPLRNGKQMHRLRIGLLPKKLLYATKQVQEYRRYLEKLVFDCHGEITASNSHRINAACAWEQNSLVCSWIMRYKFDELSMADLRGCSDQAAKARTLRNKEVECLDIEPPPLDPWAALQGDQQLLAADGSSPTRAADQSDLDPAADSPEPHEEPSHDPSSGASEPQRGAAQGQEAGEAAAQARPPDNGEGQAVAGQAGTGGAD